jgi:hypothetical protein
MALSVTDDIRAPAKQGKQEKRWPADSSAALSVGEECPAVADGGAEDREGLHSDGANYVSKWLVVTD